MVGFAVFRQNSVAMFYGIIITLLIIFAGITPVALDVAVKAVIYKRSELTILNLQVRYTTGRYQLTDIEMILEVILFSVPPFSFSLLSGV